MRKSVFVLLGVFFGIIMSKSEAVSWFRIQEMFHFHSFHMYGIIGVAVVSGVIFHFILKKNGIKDFEGKQVNIADKNKTYLASILGGSLFGIGWAMTGACPGPLYVLLGQGNLIILVIIGSALLGTLVYGALKSKLPH